MQDSAKPVLTRPLLLMMAFATGATVANLYYNQPLLDQMRGDFGVSYKEMGLIPTLTQVGYALGMLFLVPLGDKFEKKRLVMIFTALAALCLILLASASQFYVAAAASLCLGLFTMTPQTLIPFAAQMAEPERKGSVVGTMMSGVLLGVLLARTVSGYVGAAYGWRAMFGLAAAVLVVLGLVLARFLPRSTPSYQGSYFGLLRSVAQIFATQPVLREASLFGGVLFGAFSVFWSTLIYLMESPIFNLGSRTVGMYGLLGAVAALMSPLVGALSDRSDPRRTTGILMGVTFLSFLLMDVTGTSLVGLAFGVVLMDIGVQSGHVSNMSRILKLIPEAQSRLQTGYMFCYFLGGAIGSWLGTWSWAAYHWSGVCCSALALLAVGLVRYMLPA